VKRCVGEGEGEGVGFAEVSPAQTKHSVLAGN
jgi:hypothetical protein